MHLQKCKALKEFRQGISLELGNFLNVGTEVKHAICDENHHHFTHISHRWKEGENDGKLPTHRCMVAVYWID
jgi:hypothetical protein